MVQPNPEMNTPHGRGDSNDLALSFSDANALANLPAEVDIATMRQMMQTLVARVEALQQSQAIQMAGVHDRLDAVELEIPLVQEQTALRMRDLESRVNSGIEEAAASLQSEVEDKFGALASQIDAQRDELAELRESKKQTESRLARAIADIERLCSTVRPPAVSVAPVPEAIGPARSRVAEHIRPPKPVFNPAVPANSSSGFEAWKRQFMQDGEPVAPVPAPDQANGRVTICPRCLSDRTRPAALGRLDRILHMAGFNPHRCKSCAHRFYKRDTAASFTLAAPGGIENSRGHQNSRR